MRSTGVFVGVILFTKWAFGQHAPCPIDARTATCVVSASVMREDGRTPVGRGLVYRGDTVKVVAGIVYISMDPFGGTTNLAFFGGTLTLQVGERTFDVTPTSGIPALGGASCAERQIFTATLPYVVTNTGDVRVRAEYRNGLTGVTGMTVGGSGGNVFTVDPNGRLHIERTASGAHLWFYGTRASYEIQRSIDMATWSLVDTVTPVDGRVDYQLSVEGFFRTRNL